MFSQKRWTKWRSSYRNFDCVKRIKRRVARGYLLNEFVLFVNALGHVCQQSGATWSDVGVINTKGHTAVTDLHAALSGDKFTTELLEWRDLKIGEYRFRFYPGDGIEVNEEN